MIKFLPWLRVCWCPAVAHAPGNVEVKDMSVEMALMKECEGVFVREWGCLGVFGLLSLKTEDCQGINSFKLENNKLDHRNQK